MHMVPLPLRGQGHGDAGALTGSAIQITEALQAGRKRLLSCQWTVNTGGLSKLRTLCPFSGLPSGRAPRSFSSRAAERCIDLDPQWSPSEGGSPPHTLVPGRDETTAFSSQEFLKLLARFVGSSTTDTICSTAILTHFKIPDEALSHLSISSPVHSLIFMTLCHTLFNTAEILRVQMMNDAILGVPSFARSSVFVGGQRRRTHTVSRRLRSCFRNTILNLVRLHKCTSLSSKLSMVRRDIFDSGFAGHNRSIFNFKFC